MTVRVAKSFITGVRSQNSEFRSRTASDGAGTGFLEFAGFLEERLGDPKVPITEVPCEDEEVTALLEHAIIVAFRPANSGCVFPGPQACVPSPQPPSS
jgi:hypothetical protein